MDGNPQSLRLEWKPIDARSNALVVIVASLARFIWVGIFRQPMAGRRRERPDLPFPFSPPHWTARNRRTKRV